MLLGGVALAGSAQAQSSTVLKEWSMRVSNQDSALIRSAAITASASTFRNLVVSDGTTVANYPPYSARNGQAFGATAAGQWGTSAGGPGGTLSRVHYEQFTVTTAAGRTARIDSIVLNSCFYNTSSNTKLGVVYSLSNFVSDSSDVSAGVGQLSTTTGSVVLPATANGGFNNPAALFNSTTGNPYRYRFALNGATGVALAAGQTLTIRLYYSCGSSSAGRYAVLRDVLVKGAATSAAPCNAAFAYSASSYCQSGTNPTPTITGTTGGTFSVAPATGLTVNANTGALTLAGSTPGTYTVTYAASTSCSSTQTVTIAAAPTATFTYPTAAICAGQTATVSPTLGMGASAGTFSSTTGLTISAAGVINPATSTAGTYVVTNSVPAAGGCAAVSSTQSVTIAAAPTATLSAGTAPTTFCQGGSVQLTAPASTGGSYQYLLNGTAISGATAATYMASAAGSYTVRVTNAAGCSATSPAVAVTVNPLPATPTLSVAYNGNVTTLTSSASSGNQFFLNGTAISGATGQTYVVNGTPAQLGSYTVRTTNASGCVSAASAPLVVTGAAQALPGTALALYPNPTPNGQLQVELSGYQQAVELRVINALGQQVFTRAVSASTAGSGQPLSLDLTALPAGVYALQVRTAGGLAQRRFVRQ